MSLAGSLLKHVSLVMTTIATAGYLLGYWFFDGYLSGYGYSMRAMPHDYAAVMMELFLLFVHAGAALLREQWQALFAALLIGCFLMFYAALLLFLSGSKYSDRKRSGASIGERTRAWLVVTFAGLSPIASYALLVSAFILLFVPIVATNTFGKNVAKEEIANFLPCSNRVGKAPCIAFGEQGKPAIVGDVIAGTDGMVLVYDGTIAHLLKRADSLRGEARIR